MKKLFKSVTVILIASLITFLLAACASNSGIESGKGNPAAIKVYEKDAEKLKILYDQEMLNREKEIVKEHEEKKSKKRRERNNDEEI